MDIIFVAGIVITLATMVPVLRQIRTHPRGLFVLFFAEMWERFSYYGMRGLLVFYFTQHYLLSDTEAQGQYGAYTSLVWLTPLVGGVLADRWLGTRKAIAFGALLLVAGHATMAIEGDPATQLLVHQGQTYEFAVEGRGENREVFLEVGGERYEIAYEPDPQDDTKRTLQIVGLPAGGPLPAALPSGSYEIEVRSSDPWFKNVLYLALSLIILGVGFLKANISTIVGQLYSEHDPRRDPGFTLYYYGINLGAFWAAIACGWLGQNIGWWAGFGAAGVGMLAGYLVFVWGKPLLEGKGEPPDPVALKRPLFGPIDTERLIYLATIPAIGLVWLIVQRYAGVGMLLAIGSAVVLGYLGWFMVARSTKVERERLLLALSLIGASIVFWTLFEQAGTSLNQFAERSTDLHLTRAQSMTAAQTQSFNSGFILLFAPVFSAIWATLGRRGRDPDPVAKFALALVQVGLGFFVLVLGGQFADANHQVPLVFLALAYLLHTTGELCLSPVGLSQMTKLSPAALLSTVMATWFLASSWAQWIGAWIARLTAMDTIGGQVLDPAGALATYTDVFAKIGAAGIITGILMFAVRPFIVRWAHGATDVDATV